MADRGDSETGSTLFDVLRNPADRAAWGRFAERYQPLIRQWCRRPGIDETTVDDVSQIVLQKLLLGIGKYDRRKGRFRHWLKAVTRKTAITFVTRERRAGSPTPEETLEVLLAQSEAAAEFDKMLDEIIDREVLLIATQRVRLAVEPQTWEAFRLVALNGEPASAVAERLGLSLAAVYQANYRVRLRLQTEVQRLEEPHES